ncbi:MAG: hypothetical protein KAR45_01390 [Desulfobacteraceae bacterium]|nr:hypothetical protein [Desulfobacteraceae bacterium]
MKFFKNNIIKKQNFEWIKKNLDPAKSYIVFENNLRKKNDSIFSDKNLVFKYLRQEDFFWEQVFDKDLVREYLVIQIDPGNEDEMLGKLIGYEFSKETVYYLYKAYSK